MKLLCQLAGWFRCISLWSARVAIFWIARANDTCFSPQRLFSWKNTRNHLFQYWRVEQYPFTERKRRFLGFYRHSAKAPSWLATDDKSRAILVTDKWISMAILFCIGSHWSFLQVIASEVDCIGWYHLVWHTAGVVCGTVRDWCCSRLNRLSHRCYWRFPSPYSLLMSLYPLYEGILEVFLRNSDFCVVLASSLC